MKIHAVQEIKTKIYLYKFFEKNKSKSNNGNIFRDTDIERKNIDKKYFLSKKKCRHSRTSGKRIKSKFPLSTA
tara:strand:+ start:246 stop:464 length:219 start_codon:yes stop_codon:yes gene_type:complete